MTEELTRRGFAGLGLAGVAALLAGCEAADPLGQDMVALGDFQLGYSVIVSERAKKIPPSRETTSAAITAALTAELERRFGRYTGGKDYVLALAVDGYSLAPPGIPVLLTPKSLLVVTANIWEAQPQRKIGGPEQLSTFEGADTLILGSGLTKDADAQLATLARNMAQKVQFWLQRNPQWFGLPPRRGA